MKGTSILYVNKWDQRFLDLAQHVASWSKDPSRKIGAVAIGDKGQVLAQGYNGFPRGIEDSEYRYNEREEKYKYVVHAEMNCIYNASWNGVSLNKSKFYVYGLPVCSECAKGLIQVGVKSILVKVPEPLDATPLIWKLHEKLSKELFLEAGIEYARI